MRHPALIFVAILLVINFGCGRQMTEQQAVETLKTVPLDTGTGDAIRGRSLDATSFGVGRQAELRAGASDDGFVEEHLWTGIGRARSGCGAAIVGDPDQVVAKLRAYRELGIDFGGHLAAEHVRFAYTTSLERLRDGVDRIDRFLRRGR